MARIQVELVPAIGRAIIGLGVAALSGRAHGLRRLAEDIVWGEPRRSGPGARHCGCPPVQHHYHVSCEPRCYDCHR
jgi:hypothetical protein